MWTSRHDPHQPGALGDLLPIVTLAVQDAGALLRAEFHRKGGPRGHGFHADVDQEIEALLKARLQKAHPAGWTGEETGRERSTSSDVWIVDPHDGTSAFLKGLRGSSISVALVRSGQPVLGVVYAPTAPDDRGDLFAWAEGHPLTRNRQPVTQRTGGSGHVIVAMNEVAADYAAVNGEAIAPARFIALPSIAYRLALAAAGEVDAALTLGGLATWDVAGGHALLTGAGFLLTDLQGKPVDYTKGSGIQGCLGGRPEVVRDLARRNLGHVVGRGGAPRKAARPKGRILNPTQLARAQGVLLGQFAGDALGSAVEFLSPEAVTARFPAGLRNPVDGGCWKTIAGQPTDDSEMALALARSIIAMGRFDQAEVGRAYVRWFKSAPFDCGMNTRASLTAVGAGRAAASNSEANGALMRVSPIGILHAGDPIRAAADAAADARITHPAPICVATSSAYAAAIAVGVAGGDREAMWAAAHACCGEGDGAAAARHLLVAARSRPPESFDGWVVNAFQNAFHFLMTGVSLEEAVCRTAAHGDDADTNAAICGALLGAVKGREAVPVSWRNLIASCRPMATLNHVHPRPTEYWPDDALDLAEALLAAGLKEGK